MRGLFLSSVAVICCFAMSSQGSGHDTSQPKAVTAETRKAAFRRAVEMWQNGRADLIAAMVTSDYVGHSSSGDRNVAGLRKRMIEFHALYPNIRFTIEDQLCDGDRIATRMTAVGTSSTTGQRIKLSGLNISRFSGNLIAEEWPVWETLP